jgi:AcrR family transcriptional regulator
MMSFENARGGAFLKTDRSAGAANQTPEPDPIARRRENPTAQRLLDAAREVLIRDGSAAFSMRNVAQEAQLRLATVQYYFPTRDDLVRAMMRDTESRYRVAYQKSLAGVAANPLERFKAILRFNLKDVADPATRRWIIQMWALLNTLDAQSGTLLDEFYDMDISGLGMYIADLCPDTPAAEIRRRATLLAAMLEGLVVVRGAHSPRPAELKRLTALAEQLGVQIARGEIG